MRYTVAIQICALFFCLGTARAGELVNMQGKRHTDRAITLEATVKASPETVFRLWSTADGVKRFLGPDAHIGSGAGGDYTVIFDPQGDPEGLRLGTKGCRILRYDPGHFLAFEWKGTPEMPDMNTQPYPTWVEVSIEPVQGQPEYSHVKLAHYGFGHGPSFDKGYEFFDQAWRDVMGRFQKLLGRGMV